MRYALIATVPIPLEIAKKGWTRMVLYMLVNVKTLAVYLARKTPEALKPLEVLKSMEVPKIHKVQKNVHELLKIKILVGLYYMVLLGTGELTTLMVHSTWCRRLTRPMGSTSTTVTSRRGVSLNQTERWWRR